MSRRIFLLLILLIFSVSTLAQKNSGDPGMVVPYTVATLPTYSSSGPFKIVTVTDGSSASDCTVGGGSTNVLCRWNGSAWVAAGGSGNVSGPASAADGHLAVFDGTTGKLIKDGGVVPTGITNSAPENALPKSDALGNLVASPITNPSGEVVVNLPDGIITLGDYGGTNNGMQIIVNDSGPTVTIGDQGKDQLTTIEMNAITRLINITADRITLDQFFDGNVQTGNNYVDVGRGGTEEVRLRATTSIGLLASTLKVSATVTAGGTTGAQTINQSAGIVNLAATDTSLVVTNSTVSASSIIMALAQGNDATCSVKSVTKAAGTFTINMSAACTAETPVAFFVFTPQP